MITNVSRRILLEKLSGNRANHHGLYEQAYEIYCTRIIKEIEEKLSEAKSRKIVRLYSALPIPEDHTEDYDAVISLLEMSTDETIELDDKDVRKYILDRWEWERSFASNTASYVRK